MGDLDGDGVVDIAVGAEGDSAIGVEKGAVFIHYMNANGSIKSTVKIHDDTANGASIEMEGHYGSTVENIGDLDGDGVVDMAVGEMMENNYPYYRGNVHIHFMNSDGSIKSTTQIDPHNMHDQPWSTSEPWLNAEGGGSAYYMNFGSSIINIGDQDGDGVDDLAVGASKDGYSCDCDGNGSMDQHMESGAVYILHMKTDGTVKSSIRIDDNIPIGRGEISTYGTDSWPNWVGQFGSSITLADFDNDYQPELVVGASSDKETSVRDGAIYIITWNGGKKFPVVELEESISLTDAVTCLLYTSPSPRD